MKLSDIEEILYSNKLVLWDMDKFEFIYYPEIVAYYPEDLDKYEIEYITIHIKKSE